jgi:predicted Zn-dependent protease with MMP-like domain
LLKKKQFENALKLAKLAVSKAPTEFRVWANMAEVYIEIEDFESALLSLNSCPMFTFHEKGKAYMIKMLIICPRQPGHIFHFDKI